MFGCDGYVGLQRFGVFSVIVEGMMEEKKGAVCHEIRVTHKKEKKKTKKKWERKQNGKKNGIFHFVFGWFYCEGEFSIVQLFCVRVIIHGFHFFFLCVYVYIWVSGRANDFLIYNSNGLKKKKKKRKKKCLNDEGGLHPIAFFCCRVILFFQQFFFSFSLFF